MKEIERRVSATMATWERFADKPFDWATSGTCIHLVRFHAAQLGHKLPVVPRFRSALGAAKALKSTGHETVSDLLDAYFPRIAPAMARVGDLLAMEGTEKFDAIIIRASIDKYLGWHEDAETCTVMKVSLAGVKGAWRV